MIIDMDSRWRTHTMPEGYRFVLPSHKEYICKISLVDETAAKRGYIDFLPFEYKTEKGLRERREHVLHVLSVLGVYGWTTLSYNGFTRHTRSVMEFRLEITCGKPRIFTPGYQKFVHDIGSEKVTIGMTFHLPLVGGYSVAENHSRSHRYYSPETYNLKCAEVRHMEKEWGL